MAQPTYRQSFGLIKEVAWNTPLAVTSFYPVKKPSGFVPQFEDIDDDGYRNNASNLQAYYEGVGLTPVDTGEMNFYPDDSGHFLMGMLGVDTISGAGPYTHPLTLLNTAITPSYTVNLFDNLVATARRVAGVQWTEVLLKFATKGKLTIQAKGTGTIAGTVAKATEAYSVAPMFLGWQYTINVGGANTKIVEGEISLKRALDPIYGGSNSQDMTDRMVDGLSVTGYFTFVPADDTEKAFYTANTQPATSLVFTSGANVLTIQMTKTAFRKGSDFDRSANYPIVKLPFEAVANVTDAGVGNAPVKITLVNTKSTAY